MFQTGLNGKILIFISVLEAREGLSLVGALIEMDDIQLFNEKPLFTVETFFPPLLFSQYVDPRLDFCANHAHDFPHQYVNFKTNMLSVGYGGSE